MPHLRLNLVLLVNDKGEALDTYSLYHLGLGVPNRAAVVESYHRAKAAGAEIVKSPRTTWRGTPLHERWLRDPTGYNLEIYARLAPEELAEMPADQEAIYLVPGTHLPWSAPTVKHQPESAAFYASGASTCCKPWPTLFTGGPRSPRWGGGTLREWLPNNHWVVNVPVDYRS